MYTLTITWSDFSSLIPHDLLSNIIKCPLSISCPTLRQILWLIEDKINIVEEFYITAAFVYCHCAFAFNFTCLSSQSLIFILYDSSNFLNKYFIQIIWLEHPLFRNHISLEVAVLSLYARNSLTISSSYEQFQVFLFSNIQPLHVYTSCNCNIDYCYCDFSACKSSALVHTVHHFFLYHNVLCHVLCLMPFLNHLATLMTPPSLERPFHHSFQLSCSILPHEFARILLVHQMSTWSGLLTLL